MAGWKVRTFSNTVSVGSKDPAKKRHTSRVEEAATWGGDDDSQLEDSCSLACWLPPGLLPLSAGSTDSPMVAMMLVWGE